VPDPSADLGVAVTGTLYHGCAIVDHTTRSLAPEMAMLVVQGRVGWLGPADEAPDPGPDVELVDAGGTTAVAGMVDAHSHLTLPGGSHWIDRAADSTPRLLAVAEDNARLLRQAGVRWTRDVGAPVRDGRALSLTVRDRWRGRAGYPYIRAAGCWLARTGSLPGGGGGARPRGHGDRPQLPAARRPGRGRRRGGRAGARVPARRGRGAGHGRPRDGIGGDAGGDGIVGHVRGDHSAAPVRFGRGAGGAGRAPGGGACVGPARLCGRGAARRRDRLRRRVAAGQPACLGGRDAGRRRAGAL
jgi:hypothetical protein